MGMSGRLSIMGTGYRDARPVQVAEVGGEEGSCTEGRGVVISMAWRCRGCGAWKEIRGFFNFNFFYIIYLLLRYKKSYAALAMAKRKPKIQNKQT